MARCFTLKLPGVYQPVVCSVGTLLANGALQTRRLTTPSIAWDQKHMLMKLFILTVLMGVIAAFARAHRGPEPTSELS
jgi:hypothetical protein